MTQHPKFTSLLNGYLPWTSATAFYLGPAAEVKQYMVSIHAPLFRRYQTLTLHDGPTKSDPVLARVQSQRYGRAKPMDITIPLVSVSVSGEEKSSTVTMERYDAGTGAGTGKDDRVGHRFTCTFPASASGDKDRDQGQDEKFEWHRTSPAGWTLTTAYANANANEEIATISQNQGLSLTKEFTSSFLGRDVNRGQEWETLVLVSGLQLWYMDFLATMGGG